MSAITPWLLGAGVTTCLGTNIQDCLEAIRKPPQPPGFIECDVFNDQETIPYKLLPSPSLQNAEDRIYQVLDDVIQQAIKEAGLTHEQLQSAALFVGSSSFDISVSEFLYQQEIKNNPEPLPLRLSSFGNLASHIRHKFAIRGPDYSFNTACTASANALLHAANAVRLGVVENALVVGVELYNDTTALGFHGLELLTRSVMKPFDNDRNGLVPGEACSAVILGTDKNKAGVQGDFFVVGGSSTCDTHSISAANPDGSTTARVITRALETARIHCSDIQAIKVHGTASLLNDEAEAAGMLRAFDVLPPLCALKPFIGHTLGACGLTELVLFYRAIEQGFLPATPGIGVESGDLGVSLNQKFYRPDPGVFMLNYFGFGGNNSSVLIANQ